MSVDEARASKNLGDQPWPASHADHILAAQAAETRARLNAASLVSHPGERGRAREKALKRFLRGIAPRGFDVDTGFVIDSNGQQSRQQDLVFVRRDYHPVFRVSGISFFPVESVAAVVEVKSSLTSRTLTDALESGASVKRLDRTSNGQNYVVTGGAGGTANGPVDPSRHEHQVFTMVVAASSVGQGALVNAMWPFLDNDRRVWPNVISVAGAFSIAYQPPTPATGIRSDQMEGVGLRVSGPTDLRNAEPLVDAAEQLWSFLRVTPLIDVQPSRYIRGSWWPTHIYPFS